MTPNGAIFLFFLSSSSLLTMRGKVVMRQVLLVLFMVFMLLRTLSPHGAPPVAEACAQALTPQPGPKGPVP